MNFIIFFFKIVLIGVLKNFRNPVFNGKKDKEPWCFIDYG